ncbi:MAG: hypothetical protein COZ06_25860 [Armatimonadetes bacterium CG_4_10_14_3_um_filter_66_18]|nr:MAG: hypothetical protein COZ06_25860 [Armatimonadetes bacterium CG_4_10_14_3_um_filter_66_18]
MLTNLSSALVLVLSCVGAQLPTTSWGAEQKETAMTEGTLGTPTYAKLTESELRPVSITVGHGDAALQGDTNVCLQAGVDYVAALGGGVVQIAPGRYVMHDSLHLRPNVVIRGAGEETVLVKAPMVESKLSADLGYGHCDVSLAEPDKFRPGMGIHIQDDRSGGFYTTCATLTFRDGDRFGITRMLNHDYSRGANAIVRSAFPVISGYHATDCLIENLKIDGNADENGHLNGCRGGGIFLLHADRTVLRKVTVENYNGDGISFQQCEDIVVEDSLCQRNRGLGFHPGSGSLRPQMRRLLGRDNGGDGLFYCLRVTGGVLEDSQFLNNSGHGLSIGGRDTDHLIRNCTARGNGGCGVYFRPGDEAMAGSRNTIENCTLEGNCRKDGKAEVHLDAAVSDVVLKGNRIGPGDAAKDGWVGVLIEKQVKGVKLEGNRIEGATDKRVVDRR